CLSVRMTLPLPPDAFSATGIPARFRPSGRERASNSGPERRRRRGNRSRRTQAGRSGRSLSAGQHPCRNRWSRSVVAVNAFLALVALLRLERQGGDRPGLEPLQGDRRPRVLAITVGACLDAAERRVELGHDLAVAVAGAQFDRAVGFLAGAIGEIGQIGRSLL